jgi:hypothetical protein
LESDLAAYLQIQIAIREQDSLRAARWLAGSQNLGRCEFINTGSCAPAK